MNNSSLVRPESIAKLGAVLLGHPPFTTFKPMAQPSNPTWRLSSLCAAVLCTFMGSLQAQSVAPGPNPSSAPSSAPSTVPSATTSTATSPAASAAASPSPGNATQPAGAQASLTSADSPLLYDKADRADKLLAAAKQEGTLTIYTAFRPQDMPTLIAAFEAKTGIKVKFWRSGSDNVVQRIVRESGSKHQEVDLIMTPASEMLALEREHLLQAVYSPHVKDLIAQAQVSSRRSSNMIMNVVVQTYNTNVFKKENLPKTFQDLKDARFKNNLGIEAKAEEWFSKVVLTMGEDKGLALFKEIAQKNGLPPRLGVSLLHNLVIAGEVPIARGLVCAGPSGGAGLFDCRGTARQSPQRGPALLRPFAFPRDTKTVCLVGLLPHQHQGREPLCGPQNQRDRPRLHRRQFWQVEQTF